MKRNYNGYSKGSIEGKRRFSPQQWKAITFSRKLGEQIARDYPEIAEDYICGMKILNIAEQYNLTDIYDVPSVEIMKEAMRSALEKLISKAELKIIAAEHRREHGKETIKKRIGLFSISPEERKDFSKKGGQTLYEKKLGIHALSSDEKAEAGRKSALSRGWQLWSDDEKQYLLRLFKDENYQYPGTHKGQPNYKLISDELERVFEIKRSLHTLNKMKQKLKKFIK